MPSKMAVGRTDWTHTLCCTKGYQKGGIKPRQAQSYANGLTTCR